MSDGKSSIMCQTIQTFTIAWIRILDCDCAEVMIAATIGQRKRLGHMWSSMRVTVIKHTYMAVENKPV